MSYNIFTDVAAADGGNDLANKNSRPLANKPAEKGAFYLITREMIQRINELAKKKKESSLSETELLEQAQLRRAYLDTIRGRLKSTLDTIEIVDDPKQAVKVIGKVRNENVRSTEKSSLLH